jgi:hypothetical protein
VYLEIKELLKNHVWKVTPKSRVYKKKVKKKKIPSMQESARGAFEKL